MIGIIGGYGVVGAEALQYLRGLLPGRPFKIGGRKKRAGKNGIERCTWQVVDLEDKGSIAGFIAGCELVVNCAGPSHRLVKTLAEVCVDKKCNLVDAGLDNSLKSAFHGETGTTVIYAAGATPGLSGILPRVLGDRFDKVRAVRFYAGLLDTFTPSAAEDYLEGILSGFNAAGSAWKDSMKKEHCLTRRDNMALPFFQRRVSLYPYFDEESEFVARKLGLADGEWHLAFDGEKISAFLREVRTKYFSGKKQTVAELCRISALEAAGRQKYIRFVIEMTGKQRDEGQTSTLVFSADNPARITGAVTAVTAALVFEEKIKGIKPLWEVENYRDVFGKMMALKNGQLNIMNLSVAQLAEEEEGEI